MVSLITDRVSNIQAGVPVAVGCGITSVMSITGVNNYIASGDPPLEAIAANQYLVVQPPATNTGPVTIDLDGTGAKQILSPSGNPLAAGEFSTNVSYFLRYTGAAWVIISSGAVF